MGSLFKREQVRCAHILVTQEREAEALLSALKGGADFAAKARELSQCPSGRQGGDLGRFGRGQMVPEFDKVAFSLQPGELSGVVKTKFGYHVLKRLE
jgi:parvulin-like peptidyl-prolyl isomerase